MDIYLINHTTPNIPPDTCYGVTDVDLAPTFKNDLAVLLKSLPRSFEAIYTSPLKRCMKIAMEMEGNIVIQDDRIVDLNFGDWELKKWHLIDQSLVEGWMTDFSDISPRNGESFLRLSHRVEQFWEDMLNEPHKTVAVVTHANVIKASLALLLEVPISKGMSFRIDYGSVSRIRLESSGLKIDYINR